jgi:hypothetical protein
MAESMNLFVASDLPLEAFVREVEPLLKLQFQRVQDEHETWYEAISAQGRMTIGAHEFVNDRDLKFEEFNYDIAFWVNRELGEDLAEQVRQEVGWQIFRALKQTGKHALMLVDDVQRKLDEYYPPSGG